MKLIKSVALCAKLLLIKSMPIALSHHQLRMVMQAAGPLAVEKRGVLIERIGVSARRRKA
jgi:hypothetical protein